MIKLKRFSEARLGNAQDKVLAGYVKRFRLTRLQRHYLHMFFSPYRVPKGLTKEEVLQVFNLYPLLGKYRRSAIGATEYFLRIKQAPFSSNVIGTTLPEELTSGGRMTRTRFREGVRKLLHILT